MASCLSLSGLCSRWTPANSSLPSQQSHTWVEELSGVRCVTATVRCATVNIRCVNTPSLTLEEGRAREVELQ